jgi:Flp pilus assembly protein TadG
MGKRGALRRLSRTPGETSMRSVIRNRRQRGAVIVTVCMALLFLLGFIGIAVDLGRLFIVNSELQTAMDSCALAAAQELDGVGAAINGVSDSISRARSAGITAGNLNRVNLQSPDWSGQGQLTTADMTFMDSTFTATTVPSAARYVECRHRQPNIKMFLLQAMGAFVGNAAAFPANGNVVARAIATRGSSQTTCPLPLALKPKVGGVAPDYGFAVGEWITLLMGPGAATNGQIGWANLDGSASANETVAEMNGHCGTRVGDQLGTPGVQSNVVDVWNERFGIYKPTVDESLHRPDMTGYSYTDHNWPPPASCATPCIRNAYNGTPVSDPTGTAQNFVLKRQAFASCANNDPRTNSQALNVCQTITGLTFNSFSKVAAPGLTAIGGHHDYGISRRIVLVPVVDGTNHIENYACMLMLQPLSIPMASVQLEYRGNAGALGSPCVTNGLPGGTAGPLVPVLVR